MTQLSLSRAKLTIYLSDRSCLNSPCQRIITWVLELRTSLDLYNTNSHSKIGKRKTQFPSSVQFLTGTCEHDLPSKILSSSLEPDVIWIISSLWAWSWLALVKPNGTSLEAVRRQTGKNISVSSLMMINAIDKNEKKTRVSVIKTCLPRWSCQLLPHWFP